MRLEPTKSGSFRARKALEKMQIAPCIFPVHTKLVRGWLGRWPTPWPRMAAAPATCWRGRQQSTCGRRIARAPPTSTLAPRHSLAAPSAIHVGLCRVLAVVWAADSLSTLRCLAACRRSSLSFDACSQLASWRGERHRGPTPSDWWHLAATTASPAISLPGSGPCLRPTALTYSSRLLLASTLC